MIRRLFASGFIILAFGLNVCAQVILRDSNQNIRFKVIDDSVGINLGSDLPEADLHIRGKTEAVQLQILQDAAPGRILMATDAAGVLLPTNIDPDHPHASLDTDYGIGLSASYTGQTPAVLSIDLDAEQDWLQEAGLELSETVWRQLSSLTLGQGVWLIFAQAHVNVAKEDPLDLVSIQLDLFSTHAQQTLIVADGVLCQNDRMRSDQTVTVSRICHITAAGDNINLRGRIVSTVSDQPETGVVIGSDWNHCNVPKTGMWAVKISE